MRFILDPCFNRQLFLDFAKPAFEQVRGKHDGPAEPNPGRCSFRVYIFALESDDDPYSRQREGDGDLEVVGKSTAGAVNEDRDVHAEATLTIREIRQLCWGHKGRPLTATKVAGRNTMVRYAICFIFREIRSMTERKKTNIHRWSRL